MAGNACTLTIRGIRENPAITEINVRSGPNRDYELLFKAPVGLGNLPVLEVCTDEKNANFQGKTYQWLRVSFPDGREGWVRDDLADIIGDGTVFGYTVLTQLTYAFGLSRDTSVGVIRPGQTIIAPVGQPNPPAPVITPPIVSTPATPVVPEIPATPAVPVTPGPVETPPPGSADRVRRAAFAITSAFEGGGYASYQTYDAGIISYGRFQFTLAAGSFITVVTRYLERSSSPIKEDIRAYLPRIQARDESLRQDDRLKALLQQAAQDPVMQAVQDEVATDGFYLPVFDLSIHPRGIVLPLSQALIFDMAINHGRFNHLIPKTEEVLGLPPKSRLGENGATEEQFTTKLVEVRRNNLYALAEKFGYGGLKKRGDFWVNLVAAGDWHLQGDDAGNVNINGKIVQVRNP